MNGIHKQEIVEQHSKICAYNGTGTHHYNRQSREHHGKGAKKYKSERRMVIDCGKSLFNWCIKIGVPVVHDWNLLSPEQRPKNGGRCATIEQ